MKKVTIYDVAKECGCTTATISKVLNGKGYISTKKKNEIFETVKRLGYIPSNAAKNLATNKSQLIGVVLHDNNNRSITNELFSKILNSFRIAVESNGYDIVFLAKNGSTTYLQKSIARGLEGVFFLCADYSNPEILELMNSPIPNISFDYEENNQSITTNAINSIIKIVDYLASKGHKDIVFIDTKESEVAHKRLEGFKEGLKKNNIEFKEEMVQEGKYFSEGVTEEEIDKALNSGINPTAIIMPDDYSAIDAYHLLRKRNLKVGKNISVVGFDGIALSKNIHPTLTTIEQNTDEMGKTAAKMLLKNIKTGKKEIKHISIDGKLICGSSVVDLKKGE